jgi:hypothetical protein
VGNAFVKRAIRVCKDKGVLRANPSTVVGKNPNRIRGNKKNTIIILNFFSRYDPFDLGF